MNLQQLRDPPCLLAGEQVRGRATTTGLILAMGIGERMASGVAEDEASPRIYGQLSPAPYLVPIVESMVSRLAQQLRQLGDVGGDAPAASRLEQLGRWAPAPGRRCFVRVVPIASAASPPPPRISLPPLSARVLWCSVEA